MIWCLCFVREKLNSMLRDETPVTRHWASLDAAIDHFWGAFVADDIASFTRALGVRNFKGVLGTIGYIEFGQGRPESSSVT